MLRGFSFLFLFGRFVFLCYLSFGRGTHGGWSGVNSRNACFFEGARKKG